MGGFVTSCAMVLGTIWKKKLLWQPLLVYIPSYAYYNRKFRLTHNKRFFDMLNVGEEYELGYRRNKVLQKCNKILDVEDF